MVGRRRSNDGGKEIVADMKLSSNSSRSPLHAESEGLFIIFDNNILYKFNQNPKNSMACLK